jgi:hypothetical protein
MTTPNPPPPFDADAARRLIKNPAKRFDVSGDVDMQGEPFLEDRNRGKFVYASSYLAALTLLRAAVAEVDAVDKVLPGRADHPLKPSLSEWVQAVVDMSVTLTRERDRLRERVKELEQR